MGFLGSIVSTIVSPVVSTVSLVVDTVSGFLGSDSDSSNSSSSSSHHTNVQIIEDKDGIRKAELENECIRLMETAQTRIIEANSKMGLAIEKAKMQNAERQSQLERERIHLMESAQHRIIEANTKMQLAIEQAKVQGFIISQRAMAAMLVELNRLGQDSLQMLENGSFEQIRQVETMYKDLAKDIQKDDALFTQEKLPRLLERLEQFDENSPSHKLFQKAVDGQIAAHFDFITTQLNNMEARKKVVVESVLRSKERMQTHIHGIAEQQVALLGQRLEQQANLLSAPDSSLELLNSTPQGNLVLLEKSEY